MRKIAGLLLCALVLPTFLVSDVRPVAAQAPPPPPLPPPMILKVAEQTQAGVLLSYYLDGGGVDSTGKSYPLEELTVASGELLTFELGSQGQAEQLMLIMYVYPKGTGAGYWDFFPASYLLREDVPVCPSANLVASVPPDSYDVVLSLHFPFQSEKLAAM